MKKEEFIELARKLEMHLVDNEPVPDEYWDAVDFIACITSHIPNKNEQMVRYFGYYSNASRGRRKKQESGQSEYVIEDEEYNKGLSKSLSKAY